MVAITSDHSDTRGAVIVSSAVYGNSGGNIPSILPSPRDATGNMIMIGTGREHWPTVHVAYLEPSFDAFLEDDSARGYYVIGSAVYSTVAELMETAAAAVGAPGAVPGSDAETRARLGDYFAETLLLDQGTSAAKARSEIGWQPSHATLGDEFLHGNWRRAPKAGSRPTVPGRGCFGLGELVRWPRSRGGTTAGWRTWWFW